MREKDKEHNRRVILRELIIIGISLGFTIKLRSIWQQLYVLSLGRFIRENIMLFVVGMAVILLFWYFTKDYTVLRLTDVLDESDKKSIHGLIEKISTLCDNIPLVILAFITFRRVVIDGYEFSLNYILAEASAILWIQFIGTVIDCIGRCFETEEGKEGIDIDE